MPVETQDVRPLQLPCPHGELAPLEAGQQVSLCGQIYTMRDAGHQRCLAYLDEYGELPYGLHGQALFYAGPTPPAAGRPFGSIGPTTAARMDKAAARLYRAGINLTLGKGRRGAEVEEACRAGGCVYLTTVGGAAALLATHVLASELVAWPELGTEALYRIELDRLPAWVAIDSQGRQI